MKIEIRYKSVNENLTKMSAEHACVAVSTVQSNHKISCECFITCPLTHNVGEGAD